MITEVVKSPVHGLVIDSEKNKYNPILPLEEIRKLLYEAELAEPPWCHIWSVSLLTGMISGELFALTWDDVDLENGIIRLEKCSHLRGFKRKSF